MQLFSPQDCRAAREKLDGIISRVCGACAKSCCFNGTMMGSQDILRLRRAMLEDETLARRVSERLARRGQELTQTLALLNGLQQELDKSLDVPEDKRKALATNLGHWKSFASSLSAGVGTDEAELMALLRYPAIRAMTLQALAAIPQARTRLEELGKDTTSLRFHGGRLPADRCLFHLDGCIAEYAKPRKCAAFYCKSDPDLISIVRAEMTFDEFVQAHIKPMNFAEASTAVQFEAALGRRYVEPKVVIAPDRRFEDRFLDVLRNIARSVQLRPRNEGPAHVQHGDISEWLRASFAMNAAVMSRRQVTGAELYEFSIGLDAAESPLGRPWAYLLAREYMPAAPPHPFWLNNEISQPIGGLDAWYVEC